MIRHILLIKFKPDTTDPQLASIQADFLAIPEKIEGVVSVEWGMNNSPEGLNQGYTHAVLMGFEDENARGHYLPHPEHEALKKDFVPCIDNIIVFDYLKS